ncbi:amidohydrolase [Gordonibacter sp. 28C]|uniref:M20 metallopeptidase family protein n=1 Tax=Gordonibacter sp. 28C TaxID=2078569 RepID=UPI000DF81C9C|nr:M20 family metallopeptidase [Gordonibacter sp. 28C]RDB61516.1 amidohydrolase [Gordonibacter sp. 28C]
MDQKNLESAVRLRHELHAHPELSYQETWTKRHLMDFLRENTANLDIVDGGRYFYAAYRTGADRPTIAFRADFDALPMAETIDLPWGSRFEGVAHKCGHDGHAAALAGFALEVDQLGAENNIVFLFQHAEETGQGAREAVQALRDERVDEVYGWHNMSGIDLGTVYVKGGTTQFASKGMTIRLTGSPAHASQPEDGVNPSFAIAKLIDAIPELVSPEHNEGLVLCTIVQVDAGSQNFGIAASEGVLRLTIRAEKEAEMDRLQKALEDDARKMAAEQGMQAEFSFSDEFPETVNDATRADKVRRACEERGIPVKPLPAPYRASEDFGYYLKEVPGAYFYIGNGPDHPSVHTYEYDFRDENIEVGVEAFKALAMPLRVRTASCL